MTLEARLQEWFLRNYFGPSLHPRQRGKTWTVAPTFGGSLGGNQDELFALLDHFASTGDLRKLPDGSWERVPERVPPVPVVREAEGF